MRFKAHRLRRPHVSHALWTTTILVVAAGLWRINLLFAHITLDCREYYDWMVDRHASGQSLLWASMVFSIALCAYLIADILRPKAWRTSLTIRLFQALLCGLCLSASVIQWGLFLPDSRLAEPGRRIEYTLGRLPFFDVNEVILESAESFDNEAWPEYLFRHYSQSSPFAMKAGRLRCEVEEEQEERALLFWQHSVVPSGILDEPEPDN